MSKVPVFGDIGKVAGDLINKGFEFKNSFTINGVSDDGTKMTLKTIQDGEKLCGDIKVSAGMSGVPVDISVSSAAKVSVTASHSGLIPGVKATLAANIPDHTSGKLTLDYSMPHVTTKTVIGLTSSPTVQLVASAGIPSAVVGVDATYDTAKSAVTMWSVGGLYMQKDYSASIVLADKGDTIKASYHHKIDSKQSGGCELVAKSDSTTFTMGYMKTLDSGAVTKLRMSNSGLGAISYCFAPAEKTALTISGQFDATNLNKNTKLGLTMDIKA